MIKWKLESFANNTAVYLYQPEGKGTWGRVKLDRDTQKAEIIEKASASSPRIDDKAISRLEKECNGGVLPTEFIQAWG